VVTVELGDDDDDDNDDKKDDNDDEKDTKKYVNIKGAEAIDLANSKGMGIGTTSDIDISLSKSNERKVNRAASCISAARQVGSV